MEAAGSDEDFNSMSGDESSGTDSNSPHEHGQRVSLGSLCMSSPQGTRLTERHGDPATATRIELPNEDGHPCEEIGENDVQQESPYWVSPGFIPRNPQEVLTWHPNRVKATLAAEIQSRVEHMKSQRSRRKTFDPLRALADIFGKAACNQDLEKISSSRCRTTGRDFYFRFLNIITGVRIRDLRATHGDRWSDTSNEDKAQWFVLHRVVHHHRIAPVVRFPHRLHQKKAKPQSETVDSGSKKSAPEWTGYAFTLTYNTDLGTGDPDVIKLIQSGKTGESLYKAMRGMAIYSDAFADLWESSNKLARSLKFSTVNVAMEHSMKGDWDGRVHFHVFVGPDLRNGVGFAWSPELKTIKGTDVIWQDIRPNVKVSKPQKKSWNQIYQAAISGAYYVAGPKIGCIMKRSTHRPIEDMTMHICYEVLSSRLFLVIRGPCCHSNVCRCF